MGEIAARRPDIEPLGRRGAYLFLKNEKVKAYLQHPDGGTAYALSYKPQKFIEGFSSENKPQIFFIGHYHKVEQGFTRNVHYFQAQTPYMRAKGVPADLGGWIIEYDLEADGWSLESVSTKFIPVYRPIEDDWKRY